MFLQQVPRDMNLLFEARAISLERLVLWVPLLASAFPLSCLILDHRLWPDAKADVVEKRHREQNDSSRGTREMIERRPLENAGILQLDKIL